MHVCMYVNIFISLLVCIHVCKYVRRNRAREHPNSGNSLLAPAPCGAISRVVATAPRSPARHRRLRALRSKARTTLRAGRRLSARQYRLLADHHSTNPALRSAARLLMGRGETWAQDGDAWYSSAGSYQLWRGAKPGGKTGHVPWKPKGPKTPEKPRFPAYDAPSPPAKGGSKGSQGSKSHDAKEADEGMVSQEGRGQGQRESRVAVAGVCRCGARCVLQGARETHQGPQELRSRHRGGPDYAIRGQESSSGPDHESGARTGAGSHGDRGGRRRMGENDRSARAGNCHGGRCGPETCPLGSSANQIHDAPDKDAVTAERCAAVLRGGTRLQAGLRGQLTYASNGQNRSVPSGIPSHAGSCWRQRGRTRWSRGADAGPATHLSHPSGHEVRDWCPAGHQRSYQGGPDARDSEPLTEPLEGAPVGHSQVLLDDDSDLHSTGNEE